MLAIYVNVLCQNRGPTDRKHKDAAEFESRGVQGAGLGLKDFSGDSIQLSSQPVEIRIEGNEPG